MKKILLAAGIILFSSVSTYAEVVNSVEVSKYNDKYYIKQTVKNKPIECYVVYKRMQNNQFNRELHCEILDVNSRERIPFKENAKLSTEFWVNYDKLLYKKYGEYAIWHNSPASIIKNPSELKIAKDMNPLPPKNGARCNVVGMVGIYKNGACEVNMLDGMSKQEKADYHRAKDFEEEYDNYKKYKSY